MSSVEGFKKLVWAASLKVWAASLKEGYGKGKRNGGNRGWSTMAVEDVR